MKWLFDILSSDEKLGRPTEAEDLEVLTPRQRRSRIRSAGRKTDPAIVAIHQQIPVLEDILGIKLVVDHIVPVSKGGTNTADNMQIIPKDMNERKFNDIRKYELLKR